MKIQDYEKAKRLLELHKIYDDMNGLLDNNAKITILCGFKEFPIQDEVVVPLLKEVVLNRLKTINEELSKL